MKELRRRENSNFQLVLSKPNYVNEAGLGATESPVHMAAKSPHYLVNAANGTANPNPNATGTGNNGHTQPHAPLSSLGTTAVNRNSSSSYDLQQLLSHNAQNNGPSFVDSAASSSEPRHHYSSHQDYYAQPLSSPDSGHTQNHPYQQHHNQPPLHDSYGQTEFNTLANSNHLRAPAPSRPTGKFTEEWDASQRGSSIIDSPLPRPVQNDNNMSSIHRSNSFSGSTSGRGGDMDGASSIQVSRSNTLKKKSSLRRSGSLGRSSSRRSMKAGSVRSLALQSNADDDEMHSAFYCPVPTTGNPTEALANRFQCECDILECFCALHETMSRDTHLCRGTSKLINDCFHQLGAKSSRTSSPTLKRFSPFTSSDRKVS